MNKDAVIEYLVENELNDIQQVPNKKGVTVLRFYYDFDDAELEAAKAYADDEYKGEEENEWFDEFFLPYLNELAVDNVGEIMEDLMEEMDVKAEYVSYEMDRENYDYNEFIAVIYDGEEYVDMDELLSDIEEQ